MEKIYTILRQDVWGIKKQRLEPSADINALHSQPLSVVKRNVDQILNTLKSNNRPYICIDGGCGIGRLCFYILTTHNVQCHGIDINIDNDVIADAKKYGVQLCKGDILSLPYEENCVDLYFSLGVFEHFEEGIEYPLKEAYRVLKHNGILFITIPYINITRKILAPIKWIYHSVQKNNKRVFSEYHYDIREIRKILCDIGFEIVCIEPADLSGMGFWLDFPFLRSKNQGVFPLNTIGKKLIHLMNFFTPYFTTWGLAITVKK